MRRWSNQSSILRLASLALLTALLVFLCLSNLRSFFAISSHNDNAKHSYGPGERAGNTEPNEQASVAQNAAPQFLSSPAKPGIYQEAQLHVVVAHHSEEPYWIRTWLENLRSIPYVQELGVKVIIYTKGDKIDLPTLKETSGAEEVVRLPNVGREGGTYLHHLINIYDNPPQFVLFTQSYLKKAQQEKGEHTGELKDWLYDRLKNKFGSDTGFMSLDRKHDVCFCGHCSDMGRDDFYPLWPQIYTMLQGTLCQELEGQVLSFNGHFIVSKKRIIARPRTTYEFLKNLVDAPQDHWIHSEPKPKWFEKEKGKSTPSNPKFGHTLERLWHTIFDCSEPADMTDCDLRGLKVEALGGCTCKDFLSSGG